MRQIGNSMCYLSGNNLVSSLDIPKEILNMKQYNVGDVVAWSQGPYRHYGVVDGIHIAGDQKVVVNYTHSLPANNIETGSRCLIEASRLRIV